MKPIKEALAALDSKIVGVIKDALSEATTSNSSLNNIKTGNAYQSVLLGEKVTTGFRQRDASLFAGMPVAGKRFVDLGCNLGEKTRLAVLAGAAYSEGIEFEEYFVRIGGLINFFNRVQNIVLRQGDVTKPGCLTEQFDVGACFSAFVYVEKNLEQIIAGIRQMFILETHALDINWHRTYVKPVERLMPYWVLLGHTDHGAGHEETSRALLAFARDSETVALTIINRCEELPLSHADVRMLDVEGSQRAESAWGNTSGTRIFFTALRSKLMTLQAPTSADIVGVLQPELAKLSELCDAYNLEGTDFGKDRYWLCLFQGLCRFVESDSLAPNNPYLLCLRHLSANGGYDPGMAYELSDETRAIQRLTPRMERILEILCGRAIQRPLLIYNPLSLKSLEIRGYQPTDKQKRAHVCFTDGRQFRTQFMDGNHRLAALWLSGAKICPVLPVWTNIFGLDQSHYNLFPDAVRQDETFEQILAETIFGFNIPTATEA